MFHFDKHKDIVSEFLSKDKILLTFTRSTIKEIVIVHLVSIKTYNHMTQAHVIILIIQNTYVRCK